VFAGDATEAEKSYFNEETLAEDIRLLYVALTRAKYHTYVGFCRTLKKEVYQDNALSYLLGLDEKSDDPSAAFLANFNEAFTHREISAEMLQVSRHVLSDEVVIQKEPAQFTRTIAPLWRFTSFSNLSYNAQSSYFTPLLEDELEFEDSLL